MQTSTSPQMTNGSVEPIQPQTTHALLAQWLCQHQDAFRFCADLLLIASRWDDLIDHDTLSTDHHINQLLDTSLNLACNSFYAQNFASLHTLILNSIRNWKIATKLERLEDATQTDLTTAFIIRSSYVDILAHCAFILRGPEYAELIALEARRHFHSEGWQGYLDALAEEKERRAHGRLRD